MMKDDLISRAEALNTFGLSEKTRKYGGDHSGYDTIMLYEVQDALEALPSAETVQRWIPCSERLPKARESVILSTKEWTGEGCYWETTKHHVIWKGYRWNATYWDDEVIAWMPLPNPYREDGEA